MKSEWRLRQSNHDALLEKTRYQPCRACIEFQLKFNSNTPPLILRN